MNLHEINGLVDLWGATRGGAGVRVAVLDGAIDRRHPSLSTADLTRLDLAGIDGRPDEPGGVRWHGTHVASILFGRWGGPVPGIVPAARGLWGRVFRDEAGRETSGRGSTSCSPAELAGAIRRAAWAGAQVISLSGGHLSRRGETSAELAEAVAECMARDVLIVAAAGNDGCDCLHAPGGLPGVLAVGAMDDRGEPLASSNWGEAYRRQGLLAPGQDILVALPGGGTTRRTGTSYATPIVAGVSALLLGLQARPSPLAVREALLRSASLPDDESRRDDPRWLVGRLNIPGAVALIQRGACPMSVFPRGPFAASTPMPACRASEAEPESPACETPPGAMNPPACTAPATVRAATLSSCGCESCRAGAGVPAGLAAPQYVYALGSLGYDFGTEARRDSIRQSMAAMSRPEEPGAVLGEAANPHDALQLLAYLDANPWDAASILWTLNVEATPIYAIAPTGPFANDVYARLRRFLVEQLEGVERVSLAGVLAGQVRLVSGQILPAVVPELRGMYNWSAAALAAATPIAEPPKDAKKSREARQGRQEELRNFLDRVYHELRNLGAAPAERAINFAATQTFEVGNVFGALPEGWELDRIEVERSPLCRADSDCWDVILSFFNPNSLAYTTRKSYRLTVDVSDVVPVTLGRLREWFVR